jgi:hypothetical protein
VQLIDNHHNLTNLISRLKGDIILMEAWS